MEKSKGHRANKEAHPLYRSTAWRKKRIYILQRDHYQCQCYKLFGGKPCGRVATEVHHIKELKSFPELALNDDNLASLAWICHEKTKRKKKTVTGVRIIKA